MAPVYLRHLVLAALASHALADSPARPTRSNGTRSVTLIVTFTQILESGSTLTQDTQPGQRTDTNQNRRGPKPDNHQYKTHDTFSGRSRHKPRPAPSSQPFRLNPPLPFVVPDRLQRPAGRSAGPILAARRVARNQQLGHACHGPCPPCQRPAGSGPSCAARPPSKCR